PGRFERCVGRACGMVRQCRTFARLHPKTNDWAQIRGLARALLAAPLRSRYFDHSPGAERWRHRICRRRAFSRRRVLRRALFLCIGLSQPDPAALPSLPMLGHWHLHDFVAAVVTAHKIVAGKNQLAETEDFLRDAVDGAIKVFS